MRVGRTLLALVLAFALAVGLPVQAASMSAADECGAGEFAAGVAGSCQDSPSASGCDLLCPAGAACAAANATSAMLAYARPAARPALPPAEQARAPDTAPPKRLSA